MADVHNPNLNTEHRALNTQPLWLKPTPHSSVCRTTKVAILICLSGGVLQTTTNPTSRISDRRQLECIVFCLLIGLGWMNCPREVPTRLSPPSFMFQDFLAPIFYNSHLPTPCADSVLICGSIGSVASTRNSVGREKLEEEGVVFSL